MGGHKRLTRAVLMVMVGALLRAPGLVGQEPSGQMPPRKDREGFQRILPRKVRTSDMLFVGKAVCSLRRAVELPEAGLVTALETRPGQAVREGDTLARVRPLDGKRAEEVLLTAPVDGHVIWVHSDLRLGAVLQAGATVLRVGVMDPMILRSHVYEEEVLRLELGDRVRVRPESLPHETLYATVNRISWSPLSLDPLEPSFYEVDFLADNPDLVLREGLRVIIHLFKPVDSRSAEAAQAR